MKRINKEYLLSLPPHEQERYIQQLEKLAEYKRANPLYFYNHPYYSSLPQHVKQLVFHKLGLKFRTRGFFGGNQSGKTTAGIADDLIQALDEEYLPQHLIVYKKWKPPFHWRIFTPDLQSTMEGVQDKFKELVPYSALHGGSWDKAYNKVKRVTRFTNGSLCYWNSYDQDTDALGSITLMRTHYDEEPPKSHYDESQPRMMRWNGDEIFTMTPLKGLSWTYHDIWEASGGDDKLLESGKYIFCQGRKASVVVDMDDNPVLTEEAKEATLDAYDPATRKARKSGRFVHIVGMIYNEFDQNIHVGEAKHKPYKGKNVNTIVSIDPGLMKCAVVWGAVRQGGSVDIYEEMYVQDWKISDVCKEIARINNYHGVEPMYYVIDPKAKDRSKQTGKSDYSEFVDNGIIAVLGQNEVSPGINRVREYLSRGDLSIRANCKHLIKEFKLYRWKEPPKQTDEDAPEKPVKKDDHALDALRYLLMSRPEEPEEEEDDTRTPLQKIMDEDQERVQRQGARSEFGGVFN